MDVIFDWNLGNMIYNGLITLRHCGFPFTEIGVVSRWLLEHGMGMVRHADAGARIGCGLMS